MNVPNFLTISRLFMVPGFVFCYLKGGDGSMAHGMIYAAALFVLAALTDVLDGYLARRNNQITDFGKLADPLADKMMQIAAIACLAFDGRFAKWIFYVFLLKEAVLVMGGAKLLRFNKFVVYSKWSGKISTVILFMVIVAIIVTPQISFKTATLMMIICIVFTLLALFNYIQMYVNVRSTIAERRISEIDSVNKE